MGVGKDQLDDLSQEGVVARGDRRPRPYLNASRPPGLVRAARVVDGPFLQDAEERVELTQPVQGWMGVGPRRRGGIDRGCRQRGLGATYPEPGVAGEDRPAILAG